MSALTVTLPAAPPLPVLEQLLEHAGRAHALRVDPCHVARVDARTVLVQQAEARAAGRAEALLAHVRPLLPEHLAPSSLTLGPILARELDGPDTRDHRDRMRRQEERALELRALSA